MFRRAVWPLVLIALTCLATQFAFSDSLSLPAYKLPPGPTAQALRSGIEALQRGDLAAAEMSFKHVLELKPNEPHALMLLAEVALRRRMPAQTLAYLETAASKNPTSAPAHEALGRFLATRKDYAAAEAALKKAVELDSNWIDARLSLADFYLSQNKSDEAMATYRAAVQTDPNSAPAHYRLGMALQRTGDKQNAENELRTSARITPDSPLPHFALGDLLSRAGKDDLAIQEYEAANEIVPTAEGYVRLGMAQERRGRTDVAVQAYQHAILVDRDEAIAYNNLAWISAEKKQNLDDALVWAKTAVDLRPKVASFYDTLGWVLRAKGQKNEAIATLREGTDLDPQNGELWYHLGVVYSEDGQQRQALTAFGKALQLNNAFPEADDARRRLEALKAASKP